MTEFKSDPEYNKQICKDIEAILNTIYEDQGYITQTQIDLVIASYLHTETLDQLKAMYEEAERKYEEYKARVEFVNKYLND